MAKATETSWNYVWVTDKAGNQFVCPVNALKNPKDVSEAELKDCLDDAKAGLPLGD
ncbi:hypothetical protein [Dethiosulfatarculus sandiegensis]|jgi:hypothetical protein|uniref:Uncharacterized protein n=1 Tax=Dethiosulfatarculus sandiegensis TaxID=1429043 RepID=A0A0D2G7Z0_9BACT|nr:hypothetical protein [Dethiosulfatarculus sandiegensis]KIX11042.1 hypothetical protein X474_27515 [Dethiosulfatarculus sandiegensis]